MTLTKSHLADALFAKNIFTKTQSAQVIDTLFELIKQSLQNGEDVLISGFGKFSVKEKQARPARNLHTGKPIMLPSRRVVTFKCSKSKHLRDAEEILILNVVTAMRVGTD
jgi:integration host factor subunit alpha